MITEHYGMVDGKEAAEMLGIDYKYFDGLCRHKKIPFIKVAETTHLGWKRMFDILDIEMLGLCKRTVDQRKGLFDFELFKKEKELLCS